MHLVLLMLLHQSINRYINFRRTAQSAINVTQFWKATFTYTSNAAFGFSAINSLTRDTAKIFLNINLAVLLLHTPNKSMIKNNFAQRSGATTYCKITGSSEIRFS
jgi:hypothetical protein